MTLIDEFRIRTSIAHNQCRAKLASFLIDLASKLDEVVVKNAIVGLKTAFSIQKYVPKDNQWHHFAITIDCWVKRNNQNKKRRKYNRKIFIDGELKATERKVK